MISATKVKRERTGREAARDLFLVVRALGFARRGIGIIRRRPAEPRPRTDRPRWKTLLPSRRAKKNPYASEPSFARSRGIRSAAMAPKSESRGWCMLLMLVIFEGVAVIAALVAVTGTFWLGARDPRNT